MEEKELAMWMDIEIESGKTKMINVQMPDMSLMLDGGVYMFVLDGLPIYVGEANIFLNRISYHLMELREHPKYFGFQNLVGSHKLKYYILKKGLTYKAFKKSEDSKRSSDENKEERLREEKAFIEKYRPIVQKPKTEEPYPKSRRKDGMIGDGGTKGKFVSKFIENPSPYILIQ